MKILTVVGARPQFIKASAVSRAIRKANLEGAAIREVIVHTGQHFDANMSEVFFEELSIPRPDYNLNIASLSHGAMTGRMLEGVESVLMQERPDMVLVYGNWETGEVMFGLIASSPVANRCCGSRHGR